jgi:hypothetical protein
MAQSLSGTAMPEIRQTVPENAGLDGAPARVDAKIHSCHENIGFSTSLPMNMPARHWIRE